MLFMWTPCIPQEFHSLTLAFFIILYGLNTELLVDTGASVTIISSALFSMIPAEKRPQLKSPYERVKLETANNELIEVDGIATMDISIGEQQFQWDAFVALIKAPALRGRYDVYGGVAVKKSCTTGSIPCSTWDILNASWSIRMDP